MNSAFSHNMQSEYSLTKDLNKKTVVAPVSSYPGSDTHIDTILLDSILSKID